MCPPLGSGFIGRKGSSVIIPHPLHAHPPPRHGLDTSIYLAFCSAAWLLGKRWAPRYRIQLDRCALGSLSFMSQRSEEGHGLFLLLPLKASESNLPTSIAGPRSPKQRILLVLCLWHLTRLATYGNQLLPACRNSFQFSGPASVGMQTGLSPALESRLCSLQSSQVTCQNQESGGRVKDHLGLVALGSGESTQGACWGKTESATLSAFPLLPAGRLTN